MSAGRQLDRSADDHLHWFATGVDVVRRTSRAAPADRYSFGHIARSPSMQKAFAPLGPGHDAKSQAAIGRAQPRPSAINRHRR